VDGEDVVQSVFRTFFRRSAGGEFRIDSSAQIWKLLVKITLMKARARGRYHSAQKRAVAAEAAGPAALDADAWLPEALARDPDPADAVAFVDQVEALVKGLPPLYGRVLELRLQGQAPTEIAQGLNVSRQTVYRALNLLQERLRESAEPGGTGERAGSPGADL
jgi:RNA polymerase sigma-70 factor (ECF subfamily)